MSSFVTRTLKKERAAATTTVCYTTTIELRVDVDANRGWGIWAVGSPVVDGRQAGC